MGRLLFSELDQELKHVLSRAMDETNPGQFSIGDCHVQSASYIEATGVLTLGMSITYEGQQDSDQVYYARGFFLQAAIQLIRRDAKWSLGKDGVSIVSSDPDITAHRPAPLTNEIRNMYQKNHSPHEKPIENLNEDGTRVKNPNDITVNQHVIPQKHLKQWLGCAFHAIRPPSPPTSGHLFHAHPAR
ncbi:hypothetical protein A3SO_27553, partial [Pseudomonas syringae pv. actinidiae ICMP 19072]